MLKTYRKLYTARYQHALQSYALLHISDALIRYDQSATESLTDVAQFTLEFLKEAANGRCGFTACGPLQQSFLRAATECRIPFPANVDDLTSFYPQNQSSEAIINATTRLSYTQPVGQAVRCFDSSFADDFAEEWRRFVEGDSAQTSPTDEYSGVMRIDALLNG